MAEGRLFDAADVAKHNTRDSCWVILYGCVYDVTDFLSSHPDGAKIILKLAGRGATDDYDPVHPPGTLEENLKPEAMLGRVKPGSVQAAAAAPAADVGAAAPRVMASLLNLDDIEAAATERISRRAWAYYFSASDDLYSKRLNNTVYRDILLRPRVLVDCTTCDLSTSLLGQPVGVPFFIAPSAMARLAHPDGERGMAQAAGRFGAMQIISNNASMTPEQIVEGAAPDQVFGWQLYVQNDRAKSVAMLKRIGTLRPCFKFVCLTLDAPVPDKREDDERSNFEGGTHASPAGDGDDTGSGGVGQQLFLGTAGDLTWATTLPWLARHTDLPIVLKGIQTHEDALQATRHAPQVKAIILSNHGGRAADTAPPAVHTLLEIGKYCPQVFERVEVWVDGGIRRGTDVVKALCLGAKAVGLGRAPVWPRGRRDGPVWNGCFRLTPERCNLVLEAETATCMRLLGAKKISELGQKCINSRRVQREIYDGDAGCGKARL